ncbi:conjugal transfer protein TraH [Vibrio parahaemolyticus]|nr:conjugal transfer protein TraH [Vibrio parahaemolyticus]
MIEKIETQSRMESFYYAENNFGGDYRCIDSNRPGFRRGLQSEMDRLFNEMSNTTLPGVHESQRRGVFTGGAIQLSHASMSRTLFPLLHHPGRRDVVGLICLAGRSHLLTLSS